MAAELTTPDVIVAAVACVSFGSNAAAQPDATAVVVNEAVTAVLVVAEQLVVTLQLYAVDAVKPVNANEVDVFADAATVQVVAAAVLYSTR